MSPDLAAYLREIGLDEPQRVTPPSDEHLRAVLTGISPQWKPEYPGQEPPF